MFDFLPDVLRTPLAFLAVLGLLIFIHELGHYAAARWRGVHVDAFSIGFGRALASWRDSRGTEWRIAWIPLGGYVKLHGQAPIGDLPEAERIEERTGQTFHDKPVGDRAIIVAAGPIANFVLAIVLFAALYATHGVPRGLTTISVVTPGLPAEAAGVLAGDTILALDGRAISRFEDIQRYIQPRAGQSVMLRVARSGETLELPVTPVGRAGTEAESAGVIGVQGGQAEMERLGLPAAVWAGVTQTVEVSRATLVGVGEMIAGTRSARELGGPIRIAEISGQAATLGIVPLVNLMALLSVSLALLNLFPVPLLDGGHLMFYAAEAIRGRPLPPRALEFGFRAGFAMLICLFVFATWNDVAYGSIGRWVAGLVG